MLQTIVAQNNRGLGVRSQQRTRGGNTISPDDDWATALTLNQQGLISDLRRIITLTNSLTAPEPR
jgi:hypothetical protein